MPEKPSVLIVDDDRMHLTIYGWIIEAAGYQPVLAEVRFEEFHVPDGTPDLVLLDYHFSGDTTAVQIAQAIRSRLPAVPILLLSNAIAMPEDIEPLVQGFVRKGDPAKLVERIRKELEPSPSLHD